MDSLLSVSLITSSLILLVILIIKLIKNHFKKEDVDENKRRKTIYYNCICCNRVLSDGMKIKSNDVKIDIPNKIYFHNNEEKTNEEKMYEVEAIPVNSIV